MQAVHGVKWTGTSTIAVTAVNYARLAVLAHLLSPKDFGLMGMVLVITSLGQTFSDMGISNAVIWKQDATPEQISSLYWLNIMAGIAVSGIVILISPLVAKFFHEPRLVDLMFWAAFIFPIAAIGQLFQMLLQKNLLFGRLAKIEILSASIGAAVSIIAAYYGQGAYSLLWGQLALTVCASLSFTLLGWREWHPQFVFKPRKLHGFISFGLYQMGERAVNTFAYNVDYIMVGRFLGPTALGIYMLAWQIMIAPMAKLNPVLTRVAFPVFARKQADDRALRDGYVELSKMIAILTFPIIVLAAATAPVLVPFVLGPKWNAAIPIIQILALLGLLRSLSNPLWSMVLAKGRADIGFALSVAVATLSTVAFWLATPHGLNLLAWVEVMVSAVLFVVCLEILRRLIALDYAQYLVQIGRPTLLAAVMGGATYGCYRILRGTISSDLWLSIVLLVFGVLCYSLLVALFERKYFLDYLWLLLGKDKEG